MILNIVSETEMTAFPCLTCHFISNLLSAITHILNYLLNHTALELVHFRLFHLDMQKLIFPSLISLLCR